MAVGRPRGYDPEQVEDTAMKLFWARGFDGVNYTPQSVLERLRPDLQPGAIVLLHEGAAHGHNLAIIEAVLQELQAKGLRAELPDARAPIADVPSSPVRPAPTAA